VGSSSSDAQASRILFEGKRATGVEFSRGGAIEHAGAAAEGFFGRRPPFVLYFVHIPKTSGPTVDYLIRSRQHRRWDRQPGLEIDRRQDRPP